MRGAQRIITLLPLVAGLLGSPQASGQDAGRDAQLAFRAEVRAAYHLAKDERYDDACTQMSRLYTRPVLASLPERERADVLADAGLVFLMCDRSSDAYTAFKALAELRPTRWVLMQFADASERAGRPREAAAALIDVAKRWPDKVDTEVAWQAWRVFEALGEDRDTKTRLYQTLLDAGIAGAVRDASEMRYELALLHVEAGDIDRARAAVAGIIGAGPVVRMRADRRFDGVIVRDSAAMDPRLQAEALVEAVERDARANPRDVQPWIHLAQARLTLGDHAGVIADASRVLEAVAPDTPQANSEGAWKNAGSVIWLLNYRAIAHARLGNLDAAIADLERGARLREHGGPNVSQVLNLGVLYCYAGRPDDAVRVVDAVAGSLSDTGRSIHAVVRLCAAAQRGDRGEMKRFAGYLRRESPDPELALESHLWVGDVPAAERALLALLANPEQRPDALQYVQRSLRTPGMPGRAILDRNREALLARPKVQAAIAEVGRVEQVDLYLSTGFD